MRIGCRMAARVASLVLFGVAQLWSAGGGASAQTSPPDRVDGIVAQSRQLTRKNDYAGALQLLNTSLVRMPDEPRLLARRCGVLIDENDLDGAERDCRRAIAVDPRNANALTGLGNIARLRRQLDTAVLRFDQALSTGATGWSRAYALTSKAMAMRMGGEAPGPVIAVLTEAIAADATYVGAYTYRASTRLDLGQVAEAQADLNTARRINPDSYAVLVIQAQLDNEQGNYAEAVATTDLALRLRPRDWQVLHSRIVALLELGRPAPALADADRYVMLRPTSPYAHFIRGRVLHTLGRLQEAVKAYTAAVESPGGSVDALRNRGIAYYYLGQYRAALDDLSQLLGVHAERQANPEGVDQLLQFRSWCQAKLGHYTAALQDIDKAIALAPRNWELHFNKSQILWASGDPLAAKRSFDSAYRLAPEEADLSYWLGFWHWDRGDYSAARGVLAQAVLRHPNHPHAALARGVLDYRPSPSTTMNATGNPATSYRGLSGVRVPLGDLDWSCSPTVDPSGDCDHQKGAWPRPRIQ